MQWDSVKCKSRNFLSICPLPQTLHKHFQTRRYRGRNGKRDWKRKRGGADRWGKKRGTKPSGACLLGSPFMFVYASTCWYYLGRSSWRGVDRGFNCDQPGVPLSLCFRMCLAPLSHVFLLRFPTPSLPKKRASLKSPLHHVSQHSEAPGVPLRSFPWSLGSSLCHVAQSEPSLGRITQLSMEGQMTIIRLHSLGPYLKREERSPGDLRWERERESKRKKATMENKVREERKWVEGEESWVGTTEELFLFIYPHPYIDFCSSRLLLESQTPATAKALLSVKQHPEKAGRRRIKRWAVEKVNLRKDGTRHPPTSTKALSFLSSSLSKPVAL